LTIELQALDPTSKIEAAKEHNIRFVQLQFTDILGIVKSVTIPLHQLAGSVKHGTWFDGSSIEGFTRIAESDQWLRPDMDTFAEIPWQPGHGTLGAGPLGSRGTARVICDVMTPAGEPFAGASWHAPPSSATSGTRARSWSSSCFDVTRMAAWRPCPTIRPATSTSPPTWPRKSARTWSTPSKPSASASRPRTMKWRPASTRSTSSTTTVSRRPTTP
jgi:hypothetical protein